MQSFKSQQKYILQTFFRKNRALQNQKIHSIILSVYSASKKRLGAYKICYLLKAEYGIHISVGRVYRLMKSMNLPKMSTVKPKAIPHNYDFTDFADIFHYCVKIS